MDGEPDWQLARLLGCLSHCQPTVSPKRLVAAPSSCCFSQGRCLTLARNTNINMLTSHQPPGLEVLKRLSLTFPNIMLASSIAAPG